MYDSAKHHKARSHSVRVRDSGPNGTTNGVGSGRANTVARN